MESFDVKMEKKKAILRYRQMRRIAGSLRFIEIAVILVMISKLTVQFPSAIKSSSVYFRDLSVVLVSPRFVFLLGNVIIITLFAKSGKLTSQNTESKNPVTDLYQEFVEKSEKSQLCRVENRGKQRKRRSYHDLGANRLAVKGFRRSQSEKLYHEMNGTVKLSGKKLERSETEKYIKWKDEDEKRCYPEDGMSSEEFRDTIEAFIARQKKFRREEEEEGEGEGDHCLAHF